ncbi:hypothetical protein [Frondihabitans cladoniiphilus]|uniref:Uncharacterized protein n=1 Tax=Frondihabitans cladoniiphilus TaxID=715785 RepID=A0ABP8W703_9MICO
MQINKLRIDGHLLYLEPSQNVAQLKEQILASARGVAEFIDFSPVGFGQISVLMTPTTPVRFELEEHTDEQVAEWEKHPPFENYNLDDFEV